MKRSLSVALIGLILIVSPLPWFLLFRGAYYEPFNVFEAVHAIWQLGVASALIVVLLEVSGIILFGMATRRLSGWWSVAMLWLTVLTLVSVASASDWLGDMSRSPAWRNVKADA